jgi:hypothetical protein
MIKNIKNMNISKPMEYLVDFAICKIFIRLPGSSAIIPVVVSSEIPLPIPWLVILSPSHMRNIVLPSRVNMVVNKNILELLIKAERSKFEKP